MESMSVEIPDDSVLLQRAEVARYGDAVAEAGADGFHRGGAYHLSSVLPALTSALGAPVSTAIHHDPKVLQETLGIPDASSAIVVLVDGLGFWNLNKRLGHVPYMRSLMEDSLNQRPISTCFPSTTVAAMGTFGTGTCPGLTGMTGYTQINPETRELSQLIQFKHAPDPHDLQRQDTIFESLTRQGVRATSSGMPKFAASPLTEAALRGSRYVGHDDAQARVMAACTAARQPGLTYLYIRDADKVGHNYGWDSDAWIGAFEKIDAQLALLHRCAPKGTLIVIVADHGMLSASPHDRCDIAGHESLSEDVALVGGEPRAPMLYSTDQADAADIARRWHTALGEDAMCWTRDEAVEQGLFGQVEERVEAMIGDVIVSAAGTATIVDSRVQSDKATRLPSVHGSLTKMEMDIPCLIDMA
ncbi:MAG: nucleotide pyrophosphatase/phosphodiesterase family protein [Bifidobacterium psychraerophilum]